jgi:hypothetical protein
VTAEWFLSLDFYFEKTFFHRAIAVVKQSQLTRRKTLKNIINMAALDPVLQVSLKYTSPLGPVTCMTNLTHHGALDSIPLADNDYVFFPLHGFWNGNVQLFKN